MLNLRRKPTARITEGIAIAIASLTIALLQCCLRPIRDHLFPVTWIVAVEVLVALWLLPIAQGLSSHDPAAQELFNCENEARKTLAQIVAGVFFLLTFAASVKTVALQQQAGDRQEEGRINEQFRKSIELLAATLPEAAGKPNEARIDYISRIGGIYSLGQVACDYPEKYKYSTVHVLTEYVRDRALAGKDIGAQPVSVAELNQVEHQQDIQAARHVIESVESKQCKRKLATE